MKTARTYVAEKSALRNAIARCHNPKHAHYKNYGARNILVCEAWRDPLNGFQAFIEHIGPRPTPAHSLDRIDNDKGYEPGNVRWCGDWREQMLNRRKELPRPKDYGWGFACPKYLQGKSGGRCSSPLILHRGRLQTMADWARELHLATATIRQRLGRGLSIEQALSPVLLNPMGRPRANQPTRN